MSSPELSVLDADLSVEEKLFAVVKLVCNLEAECTLPQPDNNKVDEWYAPYGCIGLSGVELDKEVRNEDAVVKSAGLIVVGNSSELKLAVGREVGTRKEGLEYPPYNYEDDFLARDVLHSFLRYLERHPHFLCMGDYRRRRATEKTQQQREAAEKQVRLQKLIKQPA